MAGEVLPDSHMSVLHNLSDYLNELEEVMNIVDEKRSTKSRSPVAVSGSRSRRQRHTLQTENKQHGKQRRHVTKSCTDEDFSERQNSHPEGSRHDVVAHKVVHHKSRYSETPRYASCEGSNYFTYASPRCKKAHRKRAKRYLKGNESRVINDEIGFKDVDVVTMRIVQDEMKEMKEKLSAVVETLSNVADALVKTVTERDQLDGRPDLQESEKTVPQEAAQPDYENGVKSRRRRERSFCCFGLRAVRSSESDSDYYRPRGSCNSQSKDEKEKRIGSPIPGDQVLGETESSEGRKTRGCQNITGCYLIQRFFNRVKLLFF